MSMADAMVGKSELQGLLEQAWNLRRKSADDDGRLALTQQGIIDHARSLPHLFAAEFDIEGQGSLPAQILCACGNSTLRLMKAVIEAFPSAISLPDSNELDRLLIHKAVYSLLPVDVVKYLHKQYPQSLLLRTLLNETPLHRACQAAVMSLPTIQSARKEATIKYLVEVCPRAAVERDRCGLLPLHFLLKWPRCLKNFPTNVISIACQHNHSFASMRDNGEHGDLPIEILLEHPLPAGTTWRRMLNDLLTAHPKAVDDPALIRRVWLRVNHPWEIRLKVLEKHFSRRFDGTFSGDYTARYPLHAILHCRFSGFAIFHSDCFSQFQDRLNHFDQMGCLPLHIALRTYREDDVMPLSSITEMISVEPRACLVRDPCTGMFPFMAAAAARSGRTDLCPEDEHTKWLALIYQTLRVDTQTLLLSVHK